MNKKILSLILTITVVTLSLLTTSIANAKNNVNDEKEIAIEKLTELSKGNLSLYVDDASGKLFLSGKLSEKKIPDGGTAV